MQIEGFRLSSQQKHLFQLQQAKENRAYRAQALILIEGKLDLEILKGAIQDVVHKHEILRTTFHHLPGLTVPVQAIVDRDISSVSEHDLTALDHQDQEAQLEALLQDAKNLRFDLERGPLFHLSRITLSPSRHALLVVLPALCLDRAGLNNLMQEIGHAYTARLNNEEFSDEVLQYVDIAEWQNELLETEDGEMGRAFWRKQDIADPLDLELPFEIQPAASSDFAPQSLELMLPPGLVSKIDAFGQKYGTSRFVFLLTCFKILLWRLTGQADIVVGAGYDGRTYDELRETLGLFAKYLPLHSKLDANAHVHEILTQVHESAEEIDEWQEFFSWEQIEKSTKNDQKQLFFPYCFDVEEPFSKISVANVSFSLQRQYVCVDRFKVKLSCVERDDTLATVFHYDANYFRAGDIQRLAEQFQALLQSVTDTPEVTISQLNILGEAERQQLLVEFNKTEADYPKNKSIHRLIEEQAARTPEEIAVVFEDHQLSYAQLNARANQLARHLKRSGVGPDVLVGLCVERSVEMVVGILGILKAGGAYVPLEPTYPRQRLAFMLEDTQAPVLLTQQRLGEQLPKNRTQVICLDSDWGVIARENEENLQNGVTTGNLAYVIYTSGSSGTPKGVLVTHQNLVHSTYARMTYYCDPVDRFLLLSSFAFDSSVVGIFWTLCQGGTLYLPSPGLEQDPRQLTSLIGENQISHILSLPSLYSLLLAQDRPQQLRSLRNVIVAGEACPGRLTRTHHQLLPQASLFNEYGPTEGTVWSSVYHVGSPAEGTLVPIGRPIANTQLYILDDHLQPVPSGVVGELYIGGLGVTRGYLNRPELTGERFILNPFSDEPGAHLYKTGDLGRYLPDGTIEFLGRIDHQVKIRGYRIELEEVEAVLSQHGAVQEVVVLAKEDEMETKRLVAYVVYNSEQVPTVGELRRFLQEKLPDYMIPQAFVTLDALPLLPNGKVDRQALPAPAPDRPDLEETFVPPRTASEEVMAGIWRDVLSLEQVGIHDNFFELGGDSIISIRIVAQANQSGQQITPMQIFQHQTIAELAAVAGTPRTIQAEQGLVTGEVPLIPIQRWFFKEDSPDPHHANMAMLFEVRQTVAPDVLEKAVAHVVSHHDTLRLRFVQEESGLKQFHATPDQAMSFSQVDLSGLSDGEQRNTMEAQIAKLQASLNLSAGPLVWAALFDLGAQKPPQLLLVIHHLTIDAVSWRILLEDLQTVLSQLSRAEAVQLPPKTTSFKYWAEQLTRHAASETLKDEVSYWLAEPWERAFPLPVDFPEGRNVNTVGSSNTVKAELSAQETQTLLQDMPKAYRTQLNDILLTALVQSFSSWTGESVLLIDLEGHGREDIFEDVDLSRTVGWFTILYPVLLSLEEGAQPGEALGSIKEQLRRIPHRGIGYGLLRYLSPDTDIVEKLQALPQPEINFNYLGQLDQVLPDSSIFGLDQVFIGPDRSPRARRSHLLEVVGAVIDGCLQMDFSYSENLHRRATIESLAQGYGEALRTLITNAQSPGAGGYTPSDFPEVDLTQEELDDLLLELDGSSEEPRR